MSVNMELNLILEAAGIRLEHPPPPPKKQIDPNKGIPRHRVLWSWYNMQLSHRLHLFH
jgi:hypothetical protein